MNRVFCDRFQGFGHEDFEVSGILPGPDVLFFGKGVPKKDAASR